MATIQLVQSGSFSDTDPATSPWLNGVVPQTGDTILPAGPYAVLFDVGLCPRVVFTEPQRLPRSCEVQDGDPQ